MESCIPRPGRTAAATCPSTRFCAPWRQTGAAKAIGVVLSGTASDGTLGLQAVKAAGGITFAQERQSAKFDSMPASAIAAGVVDYVLPPAGIARQLAAIAGELPERDGDSGNA